MYISPIDPEHKMVNNKRFLGKYRHLHLESLVDIVLNGVVFVFVFHSDQGQDYQPNLEHTL